MNRAQIHKDLREATSICTMSHDTPAAQGRYARIVDQMARKVACGLITFNEAKRAIFQGA